MSHSSFGLNSGIKYKVLCNDASFLEYRVPKKEETQDEEVIRCVCGVLREEGDMLMCDQCEVSHFFILCKTTQVGRLHVMLLFVYIKRSSFELLVQLSECVLKHNKCLASLPASSLYFTW